VHTPYLLNLASPDPEIYDKSIAALSEAMRRASLLGAAYVVTHIGSHKGEGVEAGVSRVSNAVSKVLHRSETPVVMLLENSAGAGNSVGSTFEHLRAILDCLQEYEGRLGLCLDSAHLWGAGYPLSDQEEVASTIEDFDAIVGLSWLKLLHLNDTNVELGSHRDRHANVGTGKIGEAGFEAILNYPPLIPLAGIIETPGRPPEAEELDLDILKRLRQKPHLFVPLPGGATGGRNTST
jgi:deoxyribonuclease-4